MCRPTLLDASVPYLDPKNAPDVTRTRTAQAKSAAGRRFSTGTVSGAPSRQQQRAASPHPAPASGGAGPAAGPRRLRLTSNTPAGKPPGNGGPGRLRGANTAPPTLPAERQCLARLEVTPCRAEVAAVGQSGSAGSERGGWSAGAWRLGLWRRRSLHRRVGAGVPPQAGQPEGPRGFVFTIW